MSECVVGVLAECAEGIFSTMEWAGAGAEGWIEQVRVRLGEIVRPIAIAGRRVCSAGERDLN